MPANAVLPTGPEVAPIAIGSRKQFVHADVTDAVRGWLDGDPNNGLALVSEGADASLDSKENRLTGHAAEIVVVLEGPAGPAGPRGPAGPQGSRGLTGTPGSVTDIAAAIRVQVGRPRQLRRNDSLSFTVGCPGDSVLISGACGDSGNAADVSVIYAGPRDGSSSTVWECRVANRNLFSSRTVQASAICLAN